MCSCTELRCPSHFWDYLTRRLRATERNPIAALSLCKRLALAQHCHKYAVRHVCISTRGTGLMQASALAQVRCRQWQVSHPCTGQVQPGTFWDGGKVGGRWGKQGRGSKVGKRGETSRSGHKADPNPHAWDTQPHSRLLRLSRHTSEKPHQAGWVR